MARAHTYIDRAVALVGNRWMERQWQQFSGTTIALIDCADNFDWIKGPAAEIALESEHFTWGSMELGEAAWDEGADEHGAFLTCTRERPELTVAVETVAYHRIPAMLRTVRLFNKTGTPLSFGRIVLDGVAVGRKTFRARVNGFADTHMSVVHTTDERAIALQLKNRGTLWGCESAATYALAHPDARVCDVTLDRPVVAQPGTWVELPSTYFVPYKGAAEDASRSRLADLLAHRRNLIENVDKGSC